MPGRRGFLKALGVGAVGAAAGAVIGKGAEQTPEPVISMPPQTPNLRQSSEDLPVSPFLSWGYRIRDQAGCTAQCATVRYSEVEGIVAIRHEGFRGPVVMLEEDDWHGDVAAVRESTAVKLLARKHMIWSGDGPSDDYATGGFDWDKELNRHLDNVRGAQAMVANNLISRQAALDMVLESAEQNPWMARSMKLPKRGA